MTIQPPDRPPALINFDSAFDKIAGCTSNAAGRASTCMLAASFVMIWAVTGRFFRFSDTWQLIIITATIVTFLMVVLIRTSKNRDGAGIQARLDELIRIRTATNTHVGIERLSAGEIKELRHRSEQRVQQEEGDADPGSSKR